MSDQDQPVAIAESRIGQGSADYGASDITVLEGLEAVRKRPGMYIGSTGERGLHHLVYEVVDNAVDEALAGYCDHIEVTIQADGGLKVVDNGRGIPVDEHPSEHRPTVEVVMTILHAGGKFGGGGYAVSGGLHGVGVSVVNALSTRVDTEVRRQGHVWRMSFGDGGKPTTPLVKGEKTSATGTTQTFYPDPEIFETVVFDYETLRRRFQQMAFLNKGLRITLTDEREGVTDVGDEITGDETGPADNPVVGHRSDTYLYVRGLRDYVAFLNRSKKVELVHPEIIDFEAEQSLDDTHGISLEIAMQWTSAYSESVHTYANTINTTEGGTHEEGFRTALTTLVNKYARDRGLLKERDDNLAGDGGLGEADGAPHDGVEDLVAEDLQHTGEHLAGVHGAAVEHGGQHAEDAQLGVEPVDDLVDRVGQQGDAAQREVLALQRDDDAVGGGERVDGEQPEGGRAVDEDEVVALAQRVEDALEGLLAGDLADELHLGGRQVDVGRHEVHAGHIGRQDDVVDVVLGAQQQVVDAPLEGVRVHSEAEGGRSLGVEVHEEHPASELGQGGAEVDRRRGLADAALLVAQGDDHRPPGALGRGRHDELRHGPTHRVGLLGRGVRAETGQILRCHQWAPHDVGGTSVVTPVSDPHADNGPGGGRNH